MTKEKTPEEMAVQAAADVAGGPRWLGIAGKAVLVTATLALKAAFGVVMLFFTVSWGMAKIMLAMAFIDNGRK